MEYMECNIYGIYIYIWDIYILNGTIKLYMEWNIYIMVLYNVVPVGISWNGTIMEHNGL